MKNIEIQNQISKYLSSNPISLKDALNKSKSIKNYESYIYELNSLKKIYKNIPEFYDELQNYVAKMDTFIETCKEKDDSSLQNHINNYLRNKICGNSASPIQLHSLFTENIISGGEYSLKALQQIYDELGYDKLQRYIELLKRPNSFSNYINSAETQTVAMHYLLYKTNHHSPTKLKRDISVQKLYQQIKDDIDISLADIASQKDDFITFMNSEKQQYKEWYIQTNENASNLYNKNQRDYQVFLASSHSSLNNLEKIYSDKLKLEEPAKFMEEKSKHYRNSAIIWSAISVVLSVILLFLLYFILDPKITFTKHLITINLFSKQMPIYSSIVIFSMVALILYILKLFIKMAVSSKHLSEEYYQKYTLTYFYLSLLNEGVLESQQANVILATLFTKADTGLIKNDNGSDLDLVTKLFSLVKS